MNLSMEYINYKASIIGILIMLALNNINYKASINGILIRLALKYKNAISFYLFIYILTLKDMGFLVS